ncbi:hypothetical protein [Bifidobacterium aquikefiricola]|uniref:DUF4352 domain-containing protein n=1 Tax=Bifidobacterium aquikefiricola TaxID=3059038 RepID=A0AB39U5T8_9BIFI
MTDAPTPQPAPLPPSLDYPPPQQPVPNSAKSGFTVTGALAVISIVISVIAIVVALSVYVILNRSIADTHTNLAAASSHAESCDEEPSGDDVPSPEPEISDAGKIGDTQENNGITMKLLEVGDSSTISYDTCGDGCSSRKYAPKEPEAGTKYWVARVEITNSGKKSIDLTCGYPLSINAISAEQQEYDRVDSLYQVEGNPGCSSSLQPEMTAQVAYPFMIPADTHIVGIVWRGVDPESSTQSEESYFITDDDYKLSR